MKKQFILAGCAILFLTSCDKGKNTKEDNNTTEQEQVVEENDNREVAQQQETQQPFVSPIQRQEKLIEKAKSQPLTSLAINENHFDFKEVKKGETVSHRFEFTNTGDKPLIISAVKPGCGCTAPEYSVEPVLPGEKGYVTLTFNSTNFEGIQRKAAEVYANVEQLPIVLTFSANVITTQD